MGVLVSRGAQVTGLNVSVRGSVFSGAAVKCEVAAEADVFTSAGGGVGIFAYNSHMTNASVSVEGSTFQSCSADYGGGVELGAFAASAICFAVLSFELHFTARPPHVVWTLALTH